MSAIIVWAGVLGSILGVLTSAIAIAALYRGSVRKGYAAEREFLHIKESFKSLTHNIDFLTKEIDSDIGNLYKDNDKRFDDIDRSLIEIKALLLANLGVKTKVGEQ